MHSIKHQFSLLGPGLLYAGAAIGVSHLVQSTRAGAEFGFSLIWVVVLVNILKYPIFEIGPRYAAATGQSLLDGYNKIGSWAVALYVLVTVATMCIVTAAITLVTAGLFYHIAGIGLNVKILAAILLVGSSVVLTVGKYAVLDKLIKYIVISLTLCTMIALVFAIAVPVEKAPEFMENFSLTDKSHVLFLVALIGWMPAPVDIVIWHSVWSISKQKEKGGKVELIDALRDFKIGYWGTAFLAVAFLALGSLVMYGSGSMPATTAVDFASQIITLYTYTIGEWAFPFIAIAAFTVMFSTLLTVLDAFPRTLRQSSKLLLPSLNEKSFHKALYRNWMIVTVLGTSAIIFYFNSDMVQLIDFATTVSFVLAPIFAILNYKAMNDINVEESLKQPRWLKLSGLGSIAILSLISLLFLLY